MVIRLEKTILKSFFGHKGMWTVVPDPLDFQTGVDVDRGWIKIHTK